MKEYLIFAICLFLMKKKKTTAKEIASEFDISFRTVYRYIDALSLIGVPVVTKLGKGGGIELVSDYCLDTFLLSKYEKTTLFEYCQRIDVPDYIKVILKKIYN